MADEVQRSPDVSVWYGHQFEINLSEDPPQGVINVAHERYAHLIQHGIIEESAGLPKLGKHIIYDRYGDEIAEKTQKAVKAHKYVPNEDNDDDPKKDPNRDLDPLVWNCEERNGGLFKAKIVRMSKLPDTYSHLTEKRRQRIIKKSYQGLSTVVLPPKPAKKDDSKKKGGRSATRSQPQRGSKRKADEDGDQDESAPIKRVRFDDDQDAGEPDGKSDNEDAEIEKSDDEDAESEAMRKNAPLTLRALEEEKTLRRVSPSPEPPPSGDELYKDFLEEEDIDAARALEQMRASAPLTLAYMEAEKETELDHEAEQAPAPAATEEQNESTDEAAQPLSAPEAPKPKGRPAKKTKSTASRTPKVTASASQSSAATASTAATRRSNRTTFSMFRR